jgi:hypothetical protein
MLFIDQLKDIVYEKFAWTVLWEILDVTFLIKICRSREVVGGPSVRKASKNRWQVSTTYHRTLTCFVVLYDEPASSSLQL